MKLSRKVAEKPKYTYIIKDKYWRFRYQKLDCPLPGVPGSKEFKEKYAQLVALAVKPEPPVRFIPKGTFGWVIDMYFRDVEFRSLADSTKRSYRCMAKIIDPVLGDCDMVATTTAMVAAVRNSVSIEMGNSVRAFISRLYGFAASRGWIDSSINRARDLKKIKSKSEGFVPWSDDELALMLQYAEGQTRTLIILAICTAQRACDLTSMKWSQVLGNDIRVRQRKTNLLIDIPMHPMLKDELDRLRSTGPVSGRIVKHDDGSLIGKKGFNRRLTGLIRTIPNMPHRTPHGARYAAAAMMEEAGCTVYEIQAILGHSTYQQAIHYINKRKNGRAAMDKLVAHSLEEARRKWRDLGGLRVVG